MSIDKTKHKPISIIIVSYNCEKYLKKLLISLNKIKNLIHETIVIDNNSKTPPDIIKLSKGLRFKTKLVINKHNLGFSRAVNIGINNCNKELILLLNPDCLIHNKSNIESMIKLISKNKNVSVVGGKILKNQSLKQIQLSATNKINFLTGLFEFTNLKKIFPNNIWSKLFWIDPLTVVNPICVTSVCGAFTMFRKHINKNINYFDENFFLYLEDVEFGITNIKNGYKVIYTPQSSIIHYGGKSNKSIYNIDLKHWYKSRKHLFRKNLPKFQSYILLTVFIFEEKLLQLYHYLKNEPAY